jgi:CcmD family protein
MSGGTQYVVAVYAVIWFVLLLYVVASGLRTARLARETELLLRLVVEREQAASPDSAAGVGH